MVVVTIQNNGVVAAHAWVDVFTGQQAAPSMGDYGPFYRDSGVLAPAETKTLWFAIDNGFESGWVDVILDTTQTVAELDEGNNISFGNVTLPDSASTDGGSQRSAGRWSTKPEVDVRGTVRSPESIIQAPASER